MSTIGLVPVRSFARAKRRLSSAYGERDDAALQRALLADAIALLAGVSRIERVEVVTGEPEVAAAAREDGAEVRWLEPDPGLNPALEGALGELRAAGAAAALVLLADLPLLRPADVDAVLDAGVAHPLVGVPSLDGGTALLLQRPPGLLPARFGPESFEAHVAAAHERGLELHALEPGDPLARLDLDTPEDAQRIAASGRTCRTVELLRKLGA